MFIWKCCDKFLFVEMNKLFSGTSVAPVPLFFLPHDLIYDCLEFVVEPFVVNRLGQLAVEHLLFDSAAVWDHKSRIMKSGFGFIDGHIQIFVGNVDTLDLHVEPEYRIGVKRQLRREETD